MERDDIEYFKDKKILIYCKNGFRFNGTVKNIGTSCLILDDRYKGIMTVEYDSIENIVEHNDN